MGCGDRHPGGMNVHGFAASVSDPSWGRGGMEGTLAQSGLLRMRPSRRGHAPGLFRLWGVFLGARGRDPIGSELRMSFPSHRFRVVQPSASWLKLLISPTNVYYPFYLMHYYVLILHETERKRLSDSLAPKGRFLYIVPAFHCFLLLLLSF